MELNNFEYGCMIHVRPAQVKVDDGIYTTQERLVMKQVEQVNDFILESVIKCLPEGATKVLVLDKNKIREVFEKQIPKEPLFNIPYRLCPECGMAVENEVFEFQYCAFCGKAIKWR